MFLIMFAGTTAGILTIFVTASASLPLALIAGPLVGSSTGFCAALFLAWHRGSEWRSDDDLDQQTDAMVGALRSLAERRRVVDGALTIRTTKPSQAA
ncbi:hypothetical protein [Methylobacterium sp. R2-1]|uniref:hypothetical protein n=1 Tax=Methylobacterium sp. R2-1 TaxID=2587064 RepID=UPI00160E5DF0|nr:hypothetical protein [Methylobacterium sp. R2-1]MBB2960911.1 putative esterase [Methylobacterium sp. R2-1]